jgi:hypothetical protein
MKYKPDESSLISYLYGELDEAQNQKVQKYFMENPEELKQVQQLADVLGIMGKVKDKEVIAPPVFMDDDKRIRPFWSSSSFRTVLGIAASFMLILVAARLLGTEVNYHQGELRISFLGSKVQPVVEKPAYAGLTEAQVQELINASLAKNNEATETRLAENQKKLDQTIRQSLTANSQRIDNLVRETSQASQEQVRTFVAGLQTENLQLMKNYLQLSTNEQQKYVENLLVDFSKYLQEQRNQDLQILQTRFSNIEQNTDLFKQETEQILASIISNSGTSKKQSNY